MTTPTPHLWEIDHPYYCQEGNFYARPDQGLHTAYDSWTEFYEEWGELDPDYNHVFRWDWVRDSGEYVEKGEQPEPDKLLVFWVLQRKAILRSTECAITEADEPTVREWLTKRADNVRDLWDPFLASSETATA